MGFLLGKKQHFWSWDCSPQVPNYQDFQIIGCRITLKEFCCKLPFGTCSIVQLFMNFERMFPTLHHILEIFVPPLSVHC